MRALLPVLLTLLISACSTAVKDPGPPPVNYRAAIEEQMRVTLKDPYSVRDFRLGRPQKMSKWVGIAFGGNSYYWGVCAEYNAKNSYGAYVGLRRYIFKFSGENVVNSWQEYCLIN